ncbi:tRNA-specific adenosine deaminase,Cytidine and deoxycytidylate deaminase domain,Cytidine deaminase-like [Cinara cedri]|uniref:tRNA-specific adenosine deaminase,Cytidine and deoxycytidylate deaminase domain,Cytidine deaminase-like n=1 Tax=Cinara cedri TaxID=506608 RepID=A0A5E4M9M7_9HEMI|nr:tRNA-specific adenosine deaminase,Cytidine and deoxycytidylate deaminase domain,Cytidine deaminase-like [Cinara cedri]
MDWSNYMDISLSLAEEALEVGEVPVGCIFVDNDSNIIASGRNTVNKTKNATRHAEINCVDNIIKAGILEKLSNVTVVVTVEPCIMCAAMLIKIGCTNIIYGCANDRFGGCGTVLAVPGLENCKIQGGLFADQAMHLLKQFYKGQNPNAPESKVKKKTIAP